MSKNRIFKIGILLGLILLGLFIFCIGWDCPFREYLHMNCPGCGMTRAFLSILNLDFLSAIRYNIMAIPLFIILFVSVIFLVVEIMYDKDVYFKEIFKQVYTNVDFIVLTMLITLIINNIA